MTSAAAATGFMTLPASSGTGAVPEPTSTGRRPGTHTVAVVFGGTVTSSVKRPPWIRHALLTRPYGESCHAAACVSPPPGRGRISTCR